MVSMIGDFYKDKWTPRPWYEPPPYTGPLPVPSPIIQQISGISREEFDALKKEVLEMKELLIRAKKYDELTGQPDCEMDEKVALLRKVAEAVGVDLGDIFKNGGQ